MKFTLFDLMNNDNEIGKIYRDNHEYVIEIMLWNGNICKLKTVNCTKLIHNINLVDEFGDILIEDYLYKFMTVDGEDIILEIKADNLLIEKYNL